MTPLKFPIGTKSEFFSMVASVCGGETDINETVVLYTRYTVDRLLIKMLTPVGAERWDEYGPWEYTESWVEDVIDAAPVKLEPLTRGEVK